MIDDAHHIDAEDDQDNESSVVSNYKTRKNSVFCCLKLLTKYNLHSTAYENLSLAFNYALILPFVKVTCEWSF